MARKRRVEARPGLRHVDHAAGFPRLIHGEGKKACLGRIDDRDGKWLAIDQVLGDVARHLLIGAVRPTSGTLTVDGLSIGKFSDTERALYLRRIGMIFQDYKLLPKKTVWENIAFALEVCGEKSTTIKKRTAEVLEIVKLTKRARAFPYQLSGGEKQRVSIARALVHQPALIIADEPTGNLDPETGEGIIELLLDINKAGDTVILATHDRETVNRLQKRVLRLEGGKLVSDRVGGY